MSSYASTLLARRLTTAASRRMIINPRKLSSVATETAAPKVSNRPRRARCGGGGGGRHMPMRGVAKVGVLGLAGYGGYKLVQSDTPASTSRSTATNDAGSTV
mmetsp:Transcript_7590/g.15558  ORF Transcript_7590/g.15558 Transcript_7590/m.15558 type:complete len:102 (-) Transcript_7590:87-392(-)